jgi:ribonuclease HII
MPAWLRDSKMLSEARREEIFGAVGKWLEAWSVGHATSFECDRWGMTEALRVAAQRALAGLEQAPDALLIDGPVNLLRGPRGTAATGVPSGAEPRDRVSPDHASPDSIWSGSVWSESTWTDSNWSDSVLSEPVLSEPVLSESVVPHPASPDAMPTEALESVPVWSDPVWSDPVWSDPGGLGAAPSVSAPFGSEAFAGVIRPIVDGDAKCASVAAASVLAKVVRDRIMREEADHFPVYGFERNKGYPSLVHQTALRGYGPSAIHRRSWAFMEELPWRGHPCPVRMQISCADDRQGRLFPAF